MQEDAVDEQLLLDEKDVISVADAWIDSLAGQDDVWALKKEAENDQSWATCH